LMNAVISTGTAGFFFAISIPRLRVGCSWSSIQTQEGKV
jgi:hypothetical protein